MIVQVLLFGILRLTFGLVGMVLCFAAVVAFSLGIPLGLMVSACIAGDCNVLPEPMSAIGGVVTLVVTFAVYIAGMLAAGIGYALVHWEEVTQKSQSGSP